MAYDLSPQQTQSLYDGGHIGDDLYNRLMQGVPSTDNPITPMPLAPDYAPEPSAPEPSFMDSLKDRLGGFTLLPQHTQWPDLHMPGLTPSGSVQSPIVPDNAQVVDPHAIPAIAPSRGAPKLAANIQAASTSTPALPYNSTGYDQQIAALKGMGENQNAAGLEQAKNTKDYLQTSNDLNTDSQSNEIFRQGKHDLALQDLNDATSAVNAMKVNPDEFWENKNTGQKIGLGISLFLGAFGGAQNGGDNKVVGIINDAINRDIKTQQMNISNAQQGVNAKANVLSQMRSQFGDERSAEAAAKIAALDRVNMQIQQTAYKYSGPEAKLKAQKLSGEIQTLKDQEKKKFIQAQQFGGMDLTPSERLAYRKDAGERVVHGLQGTLNDTRETPKITDMKASFDALRENIAHLKALNKRSGGTLNPLNSDIEEGKSVAADTLIHMKELGRLGALTEPDMKLMGPMVPTDPTAIFKKGLPTILDTLETLTKRRYSKFIGARGLSDPTLSDEKRGK